MKYSKKTNKFKKNMARHKKKRGGLFCKTEYSIKKQLNLNIICKI